MKIGLIRHFKVKKAFPKKFLIGFSELKKWFDEYELAEIEFQRLDSEKTKWDICYCSPTQRTIKTATSLYDNKPIIINELKELNVLNLMNKKLKLPFIVWGLLIRNKSLANNELTIDFKKRINSFIDVLLSKDQENVLIVSHGFVMMYLQKEFKKRGFTGDNFKSPENGKVYEYRN